MEGLFRIPGNTQKMNAIAAHFEADPNAAIDRHTDPHDVAGLIKRWFRELPSPLIPHPLYAGAIGTVKGKQENDVAAQNQHLKEALRALPPINRRVLRDLCRFLECVSEHSAENKMTIENLAMVFAPNLLYVGAALRSFSPRLCVACVRCGAVARAAHPFCAASCSAHVVRWIPSAGSLQSTRVGSHTHAGARSLPSHTPCRPHPTPGLQERKRLCRLRRIRAPWRLSRSG